MFSAECFRGDGICIHLINHGAMLIQEYAEGRLAAMHLM